MVGYLGGIAFMTIFNSSKIKNLQKENRKLLKEVHFLKDQKKDRVEVIYSSGFDGETTVDCPDNYPDFSKDW